MAGSLKKALIGKEDMNVKESVGYPSTFTRSNSIGGVSTLTQVPNLWLSSQSVYNARYWNGGIQDDVTIQTAITAIGSSDATLYIEPGSWEIDSALTFPSNIQVMVECGALFTKLTGGSLTFNGPFTAGLYQVFSGFDSGDIIFGAGTVEKVNILWFETNTTPGTTDMTVAIQSAISACPSTGGVVYAPSGIYLFSSKINMNIALSTLKGDGHNYINPSNGLTTFLKKSTLNDIGIDMTDGCGIESIVLRGQTGNGGDGIRCNGSACRLRDIGVFEMGNDGIRLGNSVSGNFNLWRFDNIVSSGNGRDGVRIESYWPGPNANAGLLLGLMGQYNGGAALYVKNAMMNTFMNILPEVNGANGVHFADGAYNNMLYGSDLSESNTGYNLKFDSQARYNIVQISGDPLTLLDEGTLNTVSYITADGWTINNKFTIGDTPASPKPTIKLASGISFGRVQLTYSASIDIDSSVGNFFYIVVTDNVPFTIKNPTGGINGSQMTIMIYNAANTTLGTVTWDTAFKLSAWTQPAYPYNRQITFMFDTVSWYEISRTAADIPN